MLWDPTTQELTEGYTQSATCFGQVWRGVASSTPLDPEGRYTYLYWLLQLDVNLGETALHRFVCQTDCRFSPLAVCRFEAGLRARTLAFTSRLAPFTLTRVCHFVSTTQPRGC